MDGKTRKRAPTAQGVVPGGPLPITDEDDDLAGALEELGRIMEVGFVSSEGDAFSDAASEDSIAPPPPASANLGSPGPDLPAPA